MQGRVFDAKIGRFLTADPLTDGTSQGLNAYSYVRNNPLNFVDPSGLDPKGPPDGQTCPPSSDGQHGNAGCPTPITDPTMKDFAAANGPTPGGGDPNAGPTGPAPQPPATTPPPPPPPTEESNPSPVLGAPVGPPIGTATGTGGGGTGASGAPTTDSNGTSSPDYTNLDPMGMPTGRGGLQGAGRFMQGSGTEVYNNTVLAGVRLALIALSGPNPITITAVWNVTNAAKAPESDSPEARAGKWLAFGTSLLLPAALGVVSKISIAAEGLGGAASTAARFATTAERAGVLEKVLTSEGTLNTSQTVARQLAGQRGFIPVQSILDTIGSGARIADPQGVAGQFMYRAGAAFNGSEGTLEVLVDEASGQINHVLFRSGVSP